MLDRFKSMYRPTGDELSKWETRKKDMPSLGETFRLIREICAGNSSMIGTVVAHVDNLTNRMRQMEEQNRAHLEILTALLDSQSELHRKIPLIFSDNPDTPAGGIDGPWKP